MRHLRFQPEISRNIYRSNWVIAAKEQSLNVQVKKASVISKFWPLVVVAGVSMSIFFSVLFPNLLKSTTPSQNSRTPVKSLVDIAPQPISWPNTRMQVKNDCGDLGDLSLWNRASPDQLILDVKQIQRIELGGTLVQVVQCQRSASQAKFSLQWILAEGEWQLKKISRQPLGMPGNLDLTFY